MKPREDRDSAAGFGLRRMPVVTAVGGRAPRVSGRFWCLVFVLAWAATAGAATVRQPEVVVLGFQGTVEKLEPGSPVWIRVGVGETLLTGAMLRTGERSRATLQRPDGSTHQIEEWTTLQWNRTDELPIVRILKGILKFFHRDRPDTRIEGGGVSAAVLGTEFVFQVAADGTTKLTLYDGIVRLDTALGGLTMASGDVAVARSDQAPVAMARLMAYDFSAIQWALYYPAILDPADLGWRGAPEPALEPSFAAYGAGNLPRALAAYPGGRRPTSPEEELYLAALLLSVGCVDEAEKGLARVPSGGRLGRLADAHRTLIASVLRRGDAFPAEPGTGAMAEQRTVTEWMAVSYAFQAKARLGPALEAARAAAGRAPEFGFAAVRRAELEFSSGRIVPASAELDRGLARMPEQAAAHVLRGFLHAAANRMVVARASFERALSLDPSLGDAWLGRGLARIRGGDLEGGRADLVVAAAVESQRSVLRSYLGKAYADGRAWGTPAESDKARHEFDLAKKLDPRDPTPWLYAALANQQDNRVNEAIDDLRESLVRNDDRALYRSTAGLDQDRAVRSANLANLFADVGFQDMGVREATRAVNDDYANASAHLFLANSYDALRDPRQIHLRYETPWYSEYLLANLLAPVGAGSLSQAVAQNEYSKLFERDRLGWVSRTTWTSNGDWIQQVAQFGQSGNLAYSLDGYYRSEAGQRPNNELEQRALSVTAKVQAGARDGLLVQAGLSASESGDVLQRYDPETAVRGMRGEDRLEPLAHLGWSREWRPGANTVVLVSPWNGMQSLVNPSNAVPWVVLYPDGTVETGQFDTVPLDDYRSRPRGVSVEVQQLWKADRHVVVAGARYQQGHFDTTARLDVDDFAADAPASSAVDPRLERASVHAYDHWSPWRGTLLTVGVSYDRLTQPRNFRTAPLTEGTESMERVLPKLGWTATPWKGGTVRAAWARTLGGVGFDQSFRLEPVQVAGFTQVYRGLIPESLMGSVAGQEMETIGLAWDQVFSTRTWLTLSAERLSSDASREIGGYVYGQSGFDSVAAFRQELEFTERAFAGTIGQLAGRDLALTLRCRVAESELEGEFPGLPADSDFVRRERSVSSQLTFGARYRRPEGFFASWESAWTHQSNHGDAAWMEGDSYWRHDLWTGWRFFRRRAELAVGILNLTDEDYRWYPSSYFGETYRERTVAVTGRFAF